MKIRFLWYHTPFFLPLLYQNKIKALKNTKFGRCFIVGTGPSLTSEDLNKLNNETVFGANSLCTIKTAEEKFKKKFSCSKNNWYFGFLDSDVYIKYHDIIDLMSPEHVLFNTDALHHIGKKKFNIWNKAIPFHVDYHKHVFLYGKNLKTKFSRDVSFCVHDGYTILYSLLQIAVYMGYKEIYLLGADCNYDQNIQHTILAKEDSVHKEKNKTLMGPSMIASYKVAKEYADKHGIKIYNATRGGMLEVFPRVNLDDVLKN